MDMKGTKALAADAGLARTAALTFRFDYSGHGDIRRKNSPTETISRWLEASVAVFEKS